MGKLTLGEMRSRSKGKSHFFDRETMKFFAPATYSTKYNKESDTNFILVKKADRTITYKFDEDTGEIRYYTED